MLLENNPYSEDARVKREARSLAKAGYQVTVICPHRADGKSRHIREVVEPNISLYQYPPAGGHGVLGYIWEYAYSTAMSFLLSLGVLVREGFDIVHAHNPPDTMWPIAAFYRLFRKPFVFDHHDISPEMFSARFGPEGSKLIHRILVLFERISCRLANRIIATNESYKRLEMDRDHVSAEHVTVVRNGPGDRFVCRQADTELRARWGTILAYCGIMGPQDGLDYLLRSLRHLASTLCRRDFICIIMGKGDALPRLKAYAEELNVAQYVWFTGWLGEEELLRYLSTADICVDPDPSNSYNDRSTMIKIMEYMAVGKPIVAFDLPEHRISAGGAAVYAAPNDELAFAVEIARLMDDPTRRAAMGREGRKRVESELAWAHQEKKLLAVYASFQRGLTLNQ